MIVARLPCRRCLLPLWAGALTSVFCALPLGCQPTQTAPTDAAQAFVGPRGVVALGRLEPAGGLISISAIPGERLQSYADDIREGSTVNAGAQLATLASYALRDQQYQALVRKQEFSAQKHAMEVAAARAQVKQAAAARAQAEAKLQEVMLQQEKLAGLDEAAAIAEQDYATMVDLQADDGEIVTPRQLRKQRNATEQARSEYEIARKTLMHGERAAQAALEAATKNVELADENLRMLQQLDEAALIQLEIDAAQLTRNQSKLFAPASPVGKGIRLPEDLAAQGPSQDTQYTILKKYIQPGEFVAQTPVLQVADLSAMVCVAEVYEADVKEITVGQEATITSAAFTCKFAGGLQGKVERVGALVASPGLTNRNPLAPSDRSIVEVVVRIEDKGPAKPPVDGCEAEPDLTATQEAARRVGLQVTVTFGDKPGERSDAAETDEGKSPTTS